MTPTLPQDGSTSTVGGSLAEFLLNRLATKAKLAQLQAQRELSSPQPVRAAASSRGEQTLVPAQCEREPSSSQPVHAVASARGKLALYQAQGEPSSPQLVRAVASPLRAALRGPARCTGSLGSHQSSKEVSPADARGRACLEEVRSSQASEAAASPEQKNIRTNRPKSQRRGRSRTPKMSRETNSDVLECDVYDDVMRPQPARRSKLGFREKENRSTGAGESSSWTQAAAASISAAVATAKRAAASVELRLAKMTAERAVATSKVQSASRQIETLKKEVAELKITAKMVAASPRLALRCMSPIRFGISGASQHSDDERLTEQEARTVPVLRRLVTEQARSRSQTPERTSEQRVISANSERASKGPPLLSSKDRHRQLRQCDPMVSLRSQAQASFQQQHGGGHDVGSRRHHQKENRTRREQVEQKQPRSTLAQMLEEVLQQRGCNDQLEKTERSQQRMQKQDQPEHQHRQQRHQQHHQLHASTIRTSTSEKTIRLIAAPKQPDTAALQQQGLFPGHAAPSLLKRHRSRSPAPREQVVVPSENCWFPDFGSRLRLGALRAVAAGEVPQLLFSGH